MRKIKGHSKIAIDGALVDRMVDMHRRRIGTDVAVFKETILKKNEEFAKIAEAGDAVKALELRNELTKYLLNVDLAVITSIMAENPSPNDILFKVARQKLTMLNSAEMKTIYEGVEIFEYNTPTEVTEGDIVNFIMSAEREGDKVETYAMAQVRLIFKGYISHLINKEEPRTEKELETIEMIYRFLKGVEEVEGDVFDFVIGDLENIEVTECLQLGYNLGIFDEQLIVDTIAGASVAIQTFSKNNPLVEAVRTARTTLGELFENLDLEKDTFEDVVGETVSLRDKITDMASLKEHLNTARVISVVYDAKFRQNLLISKGYRAKDPVVSQALDLAVKYVSYGFAKVLDTIVHCVSPEGITDKGVLAAILFNLISVRIRSDRDICRGSEVLAKGMEVHYCSDEWCVLAEKIMEYVKDFNIPDFDATAFETFEEVEVK